MTMPAVIARPSPNHDSRGDKPIDMLIMHYTGMATAESAIARLCDPAARVSAHYLLDVDGTIYALVPETLRAFHAGVSYWAGETNVNARSIGIEIVNPGHDLGYTDFPESQIDVLIALSRDIIARHRIPPARIVGHSDVAPARKIDPGEKFPWQRLAREGVGLWPSGEMVMPTGSGDAALLLSRIGYGVPPDVETPLPIVISAFQRRFRTDRIDGIWDGECERLAVSVFRQMA